MDELLAYALMILEGYDVEDEYDRKLDELFLHAPGNDDYLSLEALGSNMKESVSYIMSHTDYTNIDKVRFGSQLMRLLRTEYDRMGIREFAKHTYPLCKRFPACIGEEEPFNSLAYADEPLSWGDIEQSKELYEKTFVFFD